MPYRFRSLLLAAPLALVACSEPPPAGTTPTTSAPAAVNTAAPSAPPATQASPPAAASTGADPALLAIGKTVYGNQCVSCHGSAGRGDGVMAGALPIKPRSFAADEWRYADFSMSAAEVEAAITRVVREGIVEAMMPGYELSLSDDEMRGVVQFVLELRRQGRGG